MKISVKLHPNSSQEKIIEHTESSIEVWIREKPTDNKANEFLIKYLKNHYKKKVNLIKGFTSKIKIIEIED